MKLIQHSILRTLAAGVLFCLALSGARADVFVANHFGQGVFRYDDSGHFLGKHLTGFQRPLGLTFGPDGGLYVNQIYTNYVSRFDPATGALSAFTSGAGYGPSPNPHQLVFGGPDHDLYVADMGNPGGGAVVRFDGVSGALEQTMVVGDFGGIGGLAVDTSGTIYVSSRSGVIYKNSTGAFETFATTNTGVEGLALGPDGNLYAGTTDGDGRVLRYRPDGTPFGVGGSTTDPTFIDSGRLTYSFSLSFGPDGQLYVVNASKDEVLRYSANGAFVDAFISNAHGLDHPSYIAFGSFAPPPVVPEPTTWLLFAMGLAVVGLNSRRQGHDHPAEASTR